MKKRRNCGSKNQQFHNPICSCASVIDNKFVELDTNNTATMIKLRLTSYEIICAVERRAPKKEYLEFEDHPAINTPSIPKLETAKINNKEYFVCTMAP